VLGGQARQENVGGWMLRGRCLWQPPSLTLPHVAPSALRGEGTEMGRAGGASDHGTGIDHAGAAELLTRMSHRLQQDKR